jgi:hypothetical protein
VLASVQEKTIAAGSDEMSSTARYPPLNVLIGAQDGPERQWERYLPMVELGIWGAQIRTPLRRLEDTP